MSKWWCVLCAGVSNRMTEDGSDDVSAKTTPRVFFKKKLRLNMDKLFRGRYSVGRFLVEIIFGEVKWFAVGKG